MIDFYCERNLPTAFNEPANILSSFAYVFFGFLLLINQQNERSSSKWHWLMILVGLGSVLFHTFAEFWTMISDIIPISILILAIFIASLKKNLHFSKRQIFLSTLSLLSMTGVITIIVPSETVNGSQPYFVPLLALGLITVSIWLKSPRDGVRYVFATLIFCAALFFRMIDNTICPYFSVGTHFIWHLLSAFGAYLLVKELCPK